MPRLLWLTVSESRALGIIIQVDPSLLLSPTSPIPVGSSVPTTKAPGLLS